MKSKIYFLDQDGDCHWYLVLASKRKEWEAWCNIPGDDERGWRVPNFAKALGGGPSQIEFRIVKDRKVGGGKAGA